jgi:tetratricopeptide (TPR) repeat protein
VLALQGGAPKFRAKAIEASGGIAWWQGDMGHAAAEYREALRLQRELGDPAELANALYNFGITTSFDADRFDGVGSPEGDEAMVEAEAIYRRLGHERGLGDVHWGMGNVALFGRGDAAAGLPLFEAAAAEYAASGSVFGEGWSNFEIGQAQLRLGRLEEADAALGRGLRLLYGTGDESSVVLFMIMFAAVSLERGDTRRAYRLAGSAWGLRDRSGLDIISIPENTTRGLDRPTLEGLTGADGEAYRAGLKMSTTQAVALALEG